ncbi:MAG: hypothetical protein VKM34_02695, partial [Cyanobacteriota bacterium]|nr:hypothetical protein [Cyanobacteriota bacterium]
GEKLSHIYNSGSFRRSAPGGERWTWEDWVNKRLPELLPGEAPKITQADCRRFLWEARQLLSPRRHGGQGESLPASVKQAEVLQALIPRQNTQTGGWAPAILDDPDAAEGLRVVWGLALQNAAKQQRKNGPTTEDVRAAREEARPQLAQAGLIREAPAAFQQSTAERVQAARQRTIDVSPPTPAQQERFKQTMASIRDTKAERTAKVEVDQVREQLDAAEQERRHTLEQEVRVYNAHLHATSKATHELLGYLQSLSRIHGTQLLDEMRCIDVLGLITVKDDMDRLKAIGTELMEAVNLARSSEPASGIHAETIEV